MAVVSFVQPAEARRVALVIGNSTYAHANFLPNTGKDTRLIANAARQAGFEVTMVDDATKARFDQVLKDFRTQADGAEVAMVYYAGHGMESAGRNWVIPVDATLSESRDLRFEAVELDGLLETVSGARLRMIVLDACRNNPFGSSWRSAVRAVPKGLVETEFEGTGALVMFAAAGGQVASDGVGENSPFARALASRIPEPGLSIHRLGSVVREEVIKETGGSQAPWVTMSLDGQEFFLVPPVGAAPAAGSVPASAGSDGRADSFAWRYADAKNSVAGYEEYLSNFPSGVFSNDARQRIAQLRAASAPPRSGPARPAAPDIVEPEPEPETAPRAALAQPAPVKPALTQSDRIQAPVPQPGAESQSLAQATTAANNVIDRAALPVLPSMPRFPEGGYPTCRDSHAAVVETIAKVVKINECLSQLTRYVNDVMNGYSYGMIKYQEELTRLYKDEVAGKTVYSPESQQKFFETAMDQHRQSNPDGANFAEYREAKEREAQDRKYLQEQYCVYAQVCSN